MEECLNIDLGLLKLKMPSPLGAEATITYNHKLFSVALCLMITKSDIMYGEHSSQLLTCGQP